MSHTNISARRIQQESIKLQKNPSDQYKAYPVDNELFIWHFSVRGPIGTPYERGVYHGQMEFPTDYPLKPPNIQFFTPNGRYALNQKICLSMTHYHPESWNASWTIGTMLQALISTFPDQDSGMMGIGSISGTPDEMIKQLALKSHQFRCEKCGLIKDQFDWEKIEQEINEQNNTKQDTGREAPLTKEIQQPEADNKEFVIDEISHKNLIKMQSERDQLKLESAIQDQKIRKKMSINYSSNDPNLRPHKQSVQYEETKPKGLSIEEKIIKSLEVYQQVLQSIYFQPNEIHQKTQQQPVNVPQNPQQQFNQSSEREKTVSETRVKGDVQIQEEKITQNDSSLSTNDGNLQESLNLEGKQEINLDTKATQDQIQLLKDDIQQSEQQIQQIQENFRKMIVEREVINSLQEKVQEIKNRNQAIVNDLRQRRQRECLKAIIFLILALILIVFQLLSRKNNATE